MKNVLLFVIASLRLTAQDPSTVGQEQTFRVALKTITGVAQSMGVGIEIKRDASGRLNATLPGDLETEVQRTTSPPGGITIQIRNAEPPFLVLFPGQESVVTLKRTVGELDYASYLIGYRRSEKDGQTHENLFWRPFYRVQGKLRIPGCEVGLGVFDFNGDGVFDRLDHRQATTIGLDLDNDGRFFGAAEYRKAEEVIDVCGLPLQVADLDPAGRYIVFRTSALSVPQLNSPVPPFSVVTTTGALIRSSDFRRKVHILDFWASWCAPCVAKLVAMESIARDQLEELTIIGINVDGPERRKAAEELIREKSLSFPQVIRAQGEGDFLWKMFGSMPDVRLSIPLYVVIDGDGLIRYAANGGDELEDLKKAVQRALSRKAK